MLITCHNCETVFQIDRAKIDPNGQQVRCSVCAHVWTISADDEPNRTLPKLNIDANRGEEATSQEASQKLEGPKLRQDTPLNQKKKKANIFTLVTVDIWRDRDAISSLICIHYLPLYNNGLLSSDNPSF
jgi:predicted Zn finger-like uncharacterized protein